MVGMEGWERFRKKKKRADKTCGGQQTDKHAKAITNVLNIIIFAIL